MKFIHIADVHLGAQPDAGTAYSKERPAELWDTFEHVIHVCEEEQTDLLLIAGDLFHRQPLLRELKEADYLFSGLSHTRVVLIAGNHDHIRADSYYRTFQWSPNVYSLFGEAPAYVDFPELHTAVYGSSYHSREIREALYDSLAAGGVEPFEILLAHGGDEKHVPFRQRILSQAGQNAENRDVGIAFYGLPQHGAVAFARHVVQHDARKVQLRLETGDARNHGGRRARHFGAVHGKDDGSLQKACHMCGRAGAFHIAAVEKSPVAFDDGHVGRASGAGKGKAAQQRGVIQKIRVQAGGRPSCGKSKPCVVDVVRSFLAGLHGKAASGEKPRESQRNQSLAASSGKPGNNESCLFHEHEGEKGDVRLYAAKGAGHVAAWGNLRGRFLHTMVEACCLLCTRQRVFALEDGHVPVRQPCLFRAAFFCRTGNRICRNRVCSEGEPAQAAPARTFFLGALPGRAEFVAPCSRSRSFEACFRLFPLSRYGILPERERAARGRQRRLP